MRFQLGVVSRHPYSTSISFNALSGSNGLRTVMFLGNQTPVQHRKRKGVAQAQILHFSNNETNMKYSHTLTDRGERVLSDGLP